MSNTSSKSNTRRLAEGGICIALALVLSYIKIPIGLSFGGFGGSINLVMIPLILFAARWGAPWGLLAGFAFGTLKYFFAEGTAINWVSIIFDYSFAYAAVGLADDLVERHLLVRRPRDQVVQVVHISLQMLSIVVIEGLFAHLRSKRFQCVGKLRHRVFHSRVR